MVGPGQIELVKTEELIEEFAGRLDSKAEATSAKPLSDELDAGAAGLACSLVLTLDNRSYVDHYGRAGRPWASGHATR